MTLKEFVMKLKQERSMKKIFKMGIILLEHNLIEINENILENDFQIVFILDEDEYQKKLNRKLIESTNWIPTGKKDYWYRTDPPRPENQFRREICIAQKKNIKSVPQFTWKDNGKRKDKHKFTKEPNKIVKQIAADFFGIDVELLEFVIEIYNPKTGTQILQESYTWKKYKVD